MAISARIWQNLARGGKQLIFGRNHQERVANNISSTLHGKCYNIRTFVTGVEREEPQNIYDSGVMLDDLEGWRELRANLAQFDSARDQQVLPILLL